MPNDSYSLPAQGVLLDATHLDLDVLAAQEDSVLGQALERVQRESRDTARGLTVHHSTSHSSSHSSGPW